jgi:amidase
MGVRAGVAGELCFLPAVELAALIRTRKVSARQVAEAHLARVQEQNPRVNAIVTLAAGRALREAATADERQAHRYTLGPLHGLPVAIKDLIDTAGLRTTYGSPIFKDHVPAADAIHVARMRQAGAIIIGKTNTPEFGAGSQTFNAVFGATRNPHNVTKTCGGSSGGSAVALACGMVPLADGTDHGGSLRNPAAFCGVVGLRPSPERVPEAILGTTNLSVNGPMARNVPDLALLLSVIADAPAGVDYRADLARDFRGVRIAWFKDMGGIPFERPVLDAVNAQRRVFEDLGCIVEDAEPDWTGVWESYDTLRAWGFAAKHAEHVRRHGALVKETIRWEVERGLRLSPADFEGASAQRAAAIERMRAFMRRYDYFIAPTAQVLPFDVNQPYPAEVAGVKMQTYTEWQKSCMLISCLENPAISMPCGPGVGLQIVGRHRDEWSLLQLARAFELHGGHADSADRDKGSLF